ncbi:MAG: helix-turn-helix domain-containing protein, partial [Desulfobacterales bacterium]|nr:helix-turn-helix domain-containing protein [Desulfobacterales bacterium]
IIQRVKAEGDKGIVHRNRGRASPHRMVSEREDLIAEIVERRYVDFGPTLAAEKLEECEGMRVSKEKLRQIMLAKGLWQRRRRR